jgi:hypothetical protein
VESSRSVVAASRRGGLRSDRAAGPSAFLATREVKPEQASKVETRMPTRLQNGEGRTDREAIDGRTRPIGRGSGHGTLEG